MTFFLLTSVECFSEVFLANIAVAQSRFLTMTMAMVTMNKKAQNQLEIWERKLLRRIFGGKKMEEGWERRTNRELYELYYDSPISELVRARRLQ